VEVVVYTHLHFDHAGGGTRLNEEGRPVPVFPRAVHLVHAEELYDAEHPTDRSRASYFPENWKPVEEAGLLNVVHGELELAPGVRTVLMKGHVRSLTAVSIESGSEKLFYPTDNMPTSAHVPGPWIMGYDLYPLDTLAWKERFLEQASDEGWTVLFEHDPEILAAKIHREGGRFEIERVPLLSSRAAHAG
jgi:glyoxylase-like metal-dependent hydrolase (beta-lactamase superfamily II)